ncbi:MAG TPA: tail fiber domain-containing protein [Streptomyces sp.]|uniref:tail fiber domain-containing protein n=1 Tax=Streptomyces sp. TaxID=1931 RepID=UPI002D45F0A5|nr:tail fiber domain-containing protein [Streptomyces sp.]HZG02757.1 tail fiber domain-containing protein [Streptomyces sp.]
MTRHAHPSCGSPPHGGDPQEPVNGHQILQAVAALPISTWRYHWEPDHVRHLGPMAQDWQAIIGLSADGHTIPLVDANGVLLTAVQALLRRVEALEARLDRLQDTPTGR